MKKDLVFKMIHVFHQYIRNDERYQKMAYYVSFLVFNVEQIKEIKKEEKKYFLGIWTYTTIILHV